jgi:hypothetical protein
MHLVGLTQGLQGYMCLKQFRMTSFTVEGALAHDHVGHQTIASVIVTHYYKKLAGKFPSQSGMSGRVLVCQR